jgi:RNA polymerase sigma factor (TIGR02999 family)
VVLSDREGAVRPVRETDAPDDERLDELIPVLYAELHGLAHRILDRELGQVTLNTTALLHEAYLKLAVGESLSVDGRDYLFAAASRAMRQVLVDHARRRSRVKRGSGATHVRLEGVQVAADRPCADVLDVNRALERLEQIRPRAARLVEGRYFGGLNLDDMARVLGISERTAMRDWAFAKAWLYRELSEVTNPS